MLRLNLQQFADGANTGAGDGGVASTDADLSSVVYGKVNAEGEEESEEAKEHEEDDDTSVATGEGEEPKKSFEELIKGEYKADYNAKVQEAIKKRFKNTTDTEQKYNPLVKALSNRYGVDGSDINALVDAVLNDDALYEEEALERGIDVATLKSIKKMEMENAQAQEILAKQEEETEKEEQWNAILSQVGEVKQIYPKFDLAEELNDEEFGKYLALGIPVQKAYEICHLAEIQTGLIDYTERKTKEKLSNSLLAGKRPSENGLKSQSPIVAKSDPSKLTNADLEEIKKRVLRGEKITF